MALNFSHQPVFPSHLSDEHLISSMRISDAYYVDGVQENNGDGFRRSWHSNHNNQDCFDYGNDRSYISSSQEAVSGDILDVLPSDPFGMDISTTFTAITGWLEDLEVGYGGYPKEEVGASNRNYQLFAGLNLLWNNAVQFQAFPGNMEFRQRARASASAGSGEWSMDDTGDPECDSSVPQAGYMEKSLRLGSENITMFGLGEGDFMDGIEDGFDVGEAPHPALAFALGYLGVRDLLVAEQVCRSLRCTVQSDSLLWRNIHVDQPLNEKITDDVLLQLTERAQGNLQSLILIDCPRITDEGLKGVLERNPWLTKLSVPGCTRLSIEGVVNCLKAHKKMGAPGMKHLRIGGLYGVTQEHFAELKLLLDMDKYREENVRKPHFYHRGSFYLSCDDDQAVDIESCPRCLHFRLVYDCPAEDCQRKNNVSNCRACTLCISRCAECGRCINEKEYVETFCLELLCADCWKQHAKSQERHGGVGSSKHYVFDEACSICTNG